MLIDMRFIDFNDVLVLAVEGHGLGRLLLLLGRELLAGGGPLE